ncbi:hypothetical protein Pelo_16068 [Pelomyxa schiedti]|nr:hypothetical protein Pelo_16068 [Pelomyxa schiedti]
MASYVVVACSLRAVDQVVALCGLSIDRCCGAESSVSGRVVCRCQHLVSHMWELWAGGAAQRRFVLVTDSFHGVLTLSFGVSPLLLSVTPSPTGISGILCATEDGCSSWVDGRHTVESTGSKDGHMFLREAETRTSRLLFDYRSLCRVEANEKWLVGFCTVDRRVFSGRVLVIVDIKSSGPATMIPVEVFLTRQNCGDVLLFFNRTNHNELILGLQSGSGVKFIVVDLTQSFERKELNIQSTTQYPTEDYIEGVLMMRRNSGALVFIVSTSRAGTSTVVLLEAATGTSTEISRVSSGRQPMSQLDDSVFCLYKSSPLRALQSNDNLRDVRAGRGLLFTATHYDLKIRVAEPLSGLTLLSITFPASPLFSRVFTCCSFV